MLQYLDKGTNKWSVIRETLTPKYGTVALDKAFDDFIKDEAYKYNKYRDKLTEVRS